jgi:hypothetical protein
MAELTDRVRVPQHVVYREFASETVVLNLETGRYHGLNRSAGRMLETLDGARDLGEAMDRLAGGWEMPREELESDLRALCDGLAERGLVEIDAGGGS